MGKSSFRKIRVFSLILIGIDFFLFNTAINAEPASSPEKVKVDLYMMSHCPFAAGVLNTLIQVKDRFQDKMEIFLWYIVDEENGTFRSVYGDGDVEEDIRRLVILKHYPELFWKYLASRSTDYNLNVWQPHALSLGMDIRLIENAVKSEEGKSLLRENLKRAKDLNVRSSSTIYINGLLYAGGWNWTSIVLAICKALNRGVSFCKELPRCYVDEDCLEPGMDARCENPGLNTANCILTKPVEIELVLLSDKKCVECGVEQLLADIKRRARGARLKEVDINSDEGQRMSDELGIKRLPALIFDKRLSQTKDFETLLKGKAISELKGGENYLVSPFGVSWGVFLDREIEPDTLHLFVMSYCLFGISAENALRKLKSIEGKGALKVVIHYIVGQDGRGGFTSLHGQKELEEDMRQLIIGRYYPESLGDYLLRRNRDIENTDWKVVAGECGFDIGLIEAKMETEGKELLGMEAILTEALGIQNSPMYLWENRYKITRTENLKKIDRFREIEIPKSGSCRQN